MKLDMKKIMKEAHRLAREIKREFPNVDYKTQVGINVKHLINEFNSAELIGSEKQIAWAKDIRNQLVEGIDNMIDIIDGKIEQPECLVFCNAYWGYAKNGIANIYRKITKLNSFKEVNDEELDEMIRNEIRQFIKKELLPIIKEAIQNIEKAADIINLRHYTIADIFIEGYECNFNLLTPNLKQII